MNDKTILMMASVAFYSSIWFWIATVEFIILAFFVFRLRKIKPKLDFSDIPKEEIKKLKKKEIDMDRLMDNINSSRKLYLELSKKCHPDNFISNDQKEIADKLFQEITSNKRNYHKLLELKQKAIAELIIKF